MLATIAHPILRKLHSFGNSVKFWHVHEISIDPFGSSLLDLSINLVLREQTAL